MGYKVILNGKAYYSKDVAKKVLNVGEAGLLKAVAQRNIGVQCILDDTLFDLHSIKVDDNICNIQNIDLFIVKCHKTVSRTGEFLHACKYIYTPKCEFFTVTCGNQYSVNFIRLRDLDFDAKYRYKNMLPIISICGTKYVALDCVYLDRNFAITF